jgi:hypothetical protein
VTGCRRAEHRRAARAAAKIAKTSQAVATVAAAEGCTCDPEVTIEDERTVCRHDTSCPLRDAGTSVCVTVDGGVVDLTSACDLAIRANTMVVAAAEAVVIVPDSCQAPETFDVFCDSVVAYRPGGRTATVYKLSDDVVADLEAQIRGER